MFADFLDDKPCEVFVAPLDVLSFAPDETEEDGCSTVVQPDILVVCDKKGLNEKNLHGLPELVVEVLSPSSSKKDQHEKFSLYEKRGVKEYWVVDPMAGWMCLYVRNDKGLLKQSGLRERLGDRSLLPSVLLEGFSVPYEKLFTSEA
jgi:Uma2 family endonuclease